MNTNPTLQEVRSDLVGTLYCLAHALDCQVREGAGAAILGLNSGYLNDWPAVDEFDLSSFDFAHDLDTVYRYAINCEIERGFISDDSETGNLGRLQTLIQMVNHNPVIDAWKDEVADVHGISTDSKALLSMVDLATARYRLDHDSHISLADIALLADMSDRSVRNALHLPGEAMLAATRSASGELIVEKMEALRWLRGRRGFKETVLIGSIDPMPESLSADEIMPFLNARLDSMMRPGKVLSDLMKLSADGAESLKFSNAGARVGLSEEKIRLMLGQNIDTFSPDDCPVVASILGLDTEWLTTQVMRARFPAAMAEIEPKSLACKVATVSPMNETACTLDVALTAAGIRNGYFNIEMRYADRFFPADSFGSRGGDQKGKAILLHHDSKNSPYDTDMRVKSEALVSTRKRFSAYFTAHEAKAGDVIRFRRIAEREYELTYIRN